MIEQVKNTEQARSEYRFISAFEMDARYYGMQKGIQQGRREGIAQGRSEGIAQGSYQTKLETARLMKEAHCETDFIMRMTKLSKEEIEKL